MRVHDPLDGIFRGKASLRLLRIFCRFPGTSFTGRELARLSRLSPSHVQVALEALEWEGLAQKQRAGRSLLWSARPRNALFAAVRRLFEEEGQLPERLVRQLRNGLAHAPIIRATLFGSVARGEEARQSDVDLLLEVRSEPDRSRLEPRLLALGDSVRDLFGLTLSPTILTRSQLREPSRHGFVADVRREGRIIRGSA
jgi:predicted nucleotidyltransferase